MKTAIVIPTIRPESMKTFIESWTPLIKKHSVKLITVIDGKNPMVEGKSAKEVMGKYAEAIVNFNGGVRNLGFAYVAKYLPEIEVILTLDDDVVPIGDTIQDHLDILDKRIHVSWMSTASEYMRGFPYKIRDEAEVVLSHGVWEGVADWDAQTQLAKGAHQPVEFPRSPIPKGIYFPLCIMNVAFKRKLLADMYMAPPVPKMNIGRSDDIFCGILAKRQIDKQNWAAVTGYARVHHERASNVHKNLRLEAKTINLMETFWRGDESHPYFKIYREKLKLYQEFIKQFEL
jgi:reversibly glycosylated polypeptide/UDP-arabinopyranose mutase